MMDSDDLADDWGRQFVSVLKSRLEDHWHTAALGSFVSGSLSCLLFFLGVFFVLSSAVCHFSMVCHICRECEMLLC